MRGRIVDLARVGLCHCGKSLVITLWGMYVQKVLVLTCERAICVEWTMAAPTACVSVVEMASNQNDNTLWSPMNQFSCSLVGVCQGNCFNQYWSDEREELMPCTDVERMS
jgi:hypothetical protein